MLQACGYRWKVDTMGLWTSTPDLWNADPGKADTGTFFKSMYRTSVDRAWNSGGWRYLVEIPNELLKKNGIINAYVYQTIPGEGRTTFEVRLGVKARKKPQDYEAPDDKHALEQVLEQLNKKGDRLYLEENRMQLFSGENLLSEVELPEGGGSETVEIESITNPEIDEIMKGAE